MAFFRRPTPLELTYIAADQQDYSPFVNQYFVEGEGDLTLESLQRAVRAAAEIIPESHLVLKGHWGFRYWDDQGPFPAVYGADGANWNGRSNAGAPILGKRIDARKGPLFEVILLEGSPRRILFRTHHGATDGMGTLFFMEQVFRALRGEPLNAPTCRLTEWDVARREPPVAKQTPGGNCEAVLRNPQQAFVPGCLWKRFLYPARPSGIGGKMMSIAADLAREKGHQRVLIRVPSNLRRYLDKSDITVSNCSGVMDLDVTAVESHQKMQQMIIAAMRAKQDIALLKPSTKWFRWLPSGMLAGKPAINRKLHEKGRYNATCMTTNMGTVDYRLYDAPAFKCTSAFGVPIPLELTPLYLSFFQGEEGTWIHVGIPHALGNQQDLDALCEEISSRLTEIEQRSKNKGVSGG